MRKSLAFLLISGMLAFVACSQTEKVLGENYSKPKTDIKE